MNGLRSFSRGQHYNRLRSLFSRQNTAVCEILALFQVGLKPCQLANKAPYHANVNTMSGGLSSDTTSPLATYSHDRAFLAQAITRLPYLNCLIVMVFKKHDWLFRGMTPLPMRLGSRWRWDILGKPGFRQHRFLYNATPSISCSLSATLHNSRRII